MKISIFNGSPRGKGSNTNVIASAFREGAESTGAEVNDYFLIEKDIHHCTGCFSCWYKTPGQCVFIDDMQELLEAYITSDVVCFATPVYSWTLTACLKNFVDRLIPLKSPRVIENHGNFDMQNSRKRSPDVMVIANAGFPGDNNFHTLKTVMSSANPVLEIYRNCGMLLQASRQDIAGKVEEYLGYVRKVGALMAGGEEIPEELHRGLQMEILSTEKYIEYIGGGKN